jgi:hypothetical protein
MTTIEDLIREAQDRQADRAVPPSQLLTGLPVRTARARRSRRWTAAGVAAAAAVAVVVAVPALTARPPNRAVMPPATAPSGSPAAPRVDPFPVFHLGYRLTWVPAGLTERVRSAAVADPGDPFGPTVTRTWKKTAVAGDPSGGPEFTLYVRTAVPVPADAMDTSGQHVTINSARGYYQPARGDHKSSVDWSPDAHTVLMIAAGHLDVTKADMLRAARSVTADPGLLDPPVRLTRLPLRWSPTGFSVSGRSAATWRSEVSATAPGTDPKTLKEDGAPTLSVVVGTTTDAPADGATLTVGGHPARHPVRTDPAGRSLTYLVVDLGSGRLMTLIGNGGITLDEMAGVAAATVVVPSAAAWLQD